MANFNVFDMGDKFGISQGPNGHIVATIEFHLVGQPTIRLRTGDVIGLDALLSSMVSGEHPCHWCFNAGSPACSECGDNLQNHEV